MSLRQVAQALAERHRFLLLTHENPDGDTIGSALGLSVALRAVGKSVAIAGIDPLPDNLSWLPEADEIRPLPEVEGDFDCLVFLDCGDERRGGDASRRFADALTINIDHHPSNTHYAEVNWVETASASVGEMIYLLLQDMDLLVPEAALPLYVAVVTDTGSFRYPSTTIRTHLIAAHLMQMGVEAGPVSDQVFERRSLASLRLLGSAVAAMELALGGRLAIMSVSQKTLTELGATKNDPEGLVNYGRSVIGVEVAAVLTELPEGKTRVSLRSRQLVDVGAIATRLGGGGHARASGCTVDGDLDAAREKIIEAVARALPGEGYGQV